MLDHLMATTLWCCVLFLGSVTQAFVCPAAATSTCPVLPQPLMIGRRPTVDSRKVVPTLLSIDSNDTHPSPPPDAPFPSSAPPAPPFGDGSSGAPPAPPFGDGSSGAPPAVPHSPGEDLPGTSDGGLRGRFRWFPQRRAGQSPGTPASPPAPAPPPNRSPAAAAAAAADAADADADQTAEESMDVLSMVPFPGSNWVQVIWREATKNFASKAVQRQQGVELLRLSGKLDTLSGKLDTLSGGVLLVVLLQVFEMGSRFPFTGQ